MGAQSSNDDLLRDGYGAEAKIILQQAKIRHEARLCECDFQGDGNRNFCMYAGWANGVIPSKHIVQDYNYNLQKKNRIKDEETE